MALPTRFPQSASRPLAPRGPNIRDVARPHSGQIDPLSRADAELVGANRHLNSVGVSSYHHVNNSQLIDPNYTQEVRDRYKLEHQQPPVQRPQMQPQATPAQQPTPQQRTGVGIANAVPAGVGYGQVKHPIGYSPIDRAMGVDRMIQSMGNGYAPEPSQFSVADQILGADRMTEAFRTPAAPAAPQQQPAPVQPSQQPQQPQQRPSQPISLPPGGLQSLVNQVQDVATTPIGGGPRLPMAQPQQFNAPQPLPANQRYPLPMQMPDGGARATADAINQGSPVPMQSGADPAVWGPGGRQYPTVTPTAQGGGQQPLSVAPRYGQSGQQAAQSLRDARQQASDFTNRGVDRIFATNGGTVERGIGAMTGPPNPSVPASAMNGATAMPYGSGSTIIRTADGRTIAAGNASAMNLLEIARANGGNIPQGSFNKSMQIAMDSSAKNPANMKRRAEVADMRSDARDRKIVTNAMRFGVRNPLAIQTAQKMGIRLPGMPRMSGDAMAGGASAMNGPAAAASVANAGNSQEWKFLGVDPASAHPSDIMTAVATAAQNGQVSDQQWQAITTAMRQRALADNRMFDGGWLYPSAGRDHRKNAWDSIANAKSPSDYIRSRKPAAN